MGFHRSGSSAVFKTLFRRLTWLVFIIALCATLLARGPAWIGKASQAHALSAYGLEGLKNWQMPASQSPHVDSAPVDDPCSYPRFLQTYLETGQASPDKCPPEELRELWRARVYWREQHASEACGIWRKLNATGDPWAAAKEAETRGDWGQVSSALRCLDLWGKPTAGSLLGTIYTGWIASLYQDLGNALRDQGNVNEALEAYTRAAYWHPGAWAGPALQTAELLVAGNQPEAAMAGLDQAILQLPEAEHATRYLLLIRLGEIAQANQQLERAIAAYQQARVELPENPFPIQRLAAFYMQLGKPDIAESVVQGGLRGPAGTTQKARTELLMMLGQIYERMKTWEAAACAYQEAIEAATQAGLLDKQTAARDRLLALQERLGRAPACGAFGVQAQPR
jgi:tetratricopeptide (TPR) repeat protein